MTVLITVLIAGHSSERAHRVAIGFQPASLIDGRRRCSRRRDMVLEMAPHGRGVRRGLQAQGPTERSSARGDLKASRIGVQPGTPARHRAVDVHDQHGLSRAVRDGDHPQQGGPEAGRSAPHARADRDTRRPPREALRDVREPRSSMRGLPGIRPSLAQSTPAAHPTSSAEGSGPRSSSATSSAGTSASDRMSMRQPVSFAARRAFWPSLPIASDSW